MLCLFEGGVRFPAFGSTPRTTWTPPSAPSPTPCKCTSWCASAVPRPDAPLAATAHPRRRGAQDRSSTSKVEVEFPAGHRQRRTECFAALERKLMAALAGKFPAARASRVYDVALDPMRFDHMPVPDFLELFADPPSPFSLPSLRPLLDPAPLPVRGPWYGVCGVAAVMRRRAGAQVLAVGDEAAAKGPGAWLEADAQPLAIEGGGGGGATARMGGSGGGGGGSTARGGNSTARGGGGTAR